MLEGDGRDRLLDRWRQNGRMHVEGNVSLVSRSLKTHSEGCKSLGRCGRIDHGIAGVRTGEYMLGEMSVFHYLKDPLILKDLKGRLELEASLE